MYITYPQRLILEIIQRGEINARQLQSITGMDEDLLDRILKDFLVKGLIIQNHLGDFKFTNNLNQEMKKHLLDKESLHIETSDLLNDCLADRIFQENQKSFNCKKISMTEREYKIYQGLIYNLNSFLSELEHRPFEKQYNQIIYWGERNYEDVIHNAFDI